VSQRIAEPIAELLRQLLFQLSNAIVQGGYHGFNFSF
jgi:hypothetical protein